MRHLIASLIAMAIIAMTACTGPADSAVPRRTAYPRIAPYDSAYVDLAAAPVTFMVNRDATPTVTPKDDGATWVNLRYDRYDATVYCTITPVDANTVEQVIDNRAERIHRNLGTSSPTYVDIDSHGGYHASLVLSPTLGITPVQFLSVNGDKPRWVVSGTVFFDNASSITSADSIRPMVDVLERDIRVLLKSLSDR